MTDNELIQRFKDGDSKSFDELVKRYYPESYRFFSRMVWDPMDVDDLCQETYLRVFKGLGKFRQESQFSTWLYRISINVANSYFRKQRLAQILAFGTKVEAVHSDGSDENLSFRKELWNAIAKLPKKQKMVLILRTFQQLTFKEVAGVIGMSENSAKVNYHHAIKRLKELMGQR